MENYTVVLSHHKNSAETAYHNNSSPTTTKFVYFDDSTENSTLNFTTNCIIQQYEGYLPWDKPTNVISAEAEEWVQQIKDALILPILFLIGGPANIISMAVFYKQGLKERINVCLFSLALADFLYLLQTALIRGEGMFHLFRAERFGPFASELINNYLGGFFGFTFSSQVTSAIISTERCICIHSPLRAQTLFKTSTIVVIIILVNVVCVGLYSFVMTRYHVGCLYDPVTGAETLSAVLSDFYLEHQQAIDVLDGLVFLAALPFLTMAVVTITTIITAKKLKEAASWRSESSTRGATTSKRSATISSQELAVTRMLMYNSLLFILFNAPSVVFGITSLLEPSMNVGGDQHNLFAVGLWLLDIFSFCNSSFNIFIYYSMGSKYRSTFWAIFGLCRIKKAIKKMKKNEETIAADSLPSYSIYHNYAPISTATNK